jgi:MFS transporter, Spinster family, sphingosine-1-phosphate transporter
MHHSTTSAATGVGRVLLLLLAINLINYIDRYILAAVEPLIAEHFFASNDENAMAKTGALAFAFLASYMLLAPCFGALADRFSRWKIIAGGVALWSLASGASGLAASFGALLVTRIFVGVGEAAYGPAAPTIISDLYPVERRGRMLAYFYMAMPVGSALGYAFGGAIADAFDRPGHWGSLLQKGAIALGYPEGWRWPFFLVALPGLLLAVCCLFLRDPRAVQAATSKPARATVRMADVLALFRIRSYVLNTAAMTAMTFAIGGMSFWLPRYLYSFRAGDFGGAPSLSRITLIFGAITALAGLLATLLGGWAGDWLRRRFRSSYFLVSGIGILFAFPATLAILYTPFPRAWAFIFIAVFFLFFNTGPANAALANTTPQKVRSTAFALNILIIHAFGDAISPALIGWIAGHTNMNVAFQLVSGTMVLASAFWLIGARYLGRDTEAVEQASVPGGASIPA